MAPPAGTLRVRRYFLALIVLLGLLYTIVLWPGQRHTPKLGLDLVGGTQVTFTAKTLGGKVPTKSSMNQAKQIMEARVNGAGVTGATVIIQGANQIVISIPGSTDTDVAKLGSAAVLNFRPVVMPAVPVAHPVGAPGPSRTAPAPSTAPSGSVTVSPVPTPTSSSSAKNFAGLAAAARPQSAPTPKPTATKPKPTASKPKPTASKQPSGPATSPAPPKSPASVAPPQQASANPFKGLSFPIPTSYTAYAKLPPPQQQQLQGALSNFDCASAQSEPDEKTKYFLACEGGQLAYLLGPVIVPGNEIKSASAQSPVISQGQTEWTVSLELKTTGSTNWAKYTGAHNIGGSAQTAGSVTQCGAGGAPCADYVAFTLDGNVISSPVNQSPIGAGQKTEISGRFNQKSSKQLAEQLKYGALPLSFKAEDARTVSATLGSSQLKAGLLAGGIGLALVVIYSLIYYRALGLVTIASLLVSGGLTYGALVMLGTQIDFTLSLAGIAGFIVAVGITADSFVVFFERMKDEVHEGRSARVAIPRAWVRARRTILSADTVSFLAAATLYYFAAGDVKGFAFTLGLSTVLDLVVVFLFTHPLVSWLSRSRTFGSARFTGLDSAREGGMAPAAPESAQRLRAKPARPTASSPTKSSRAPVALLERDEAPSTELAEDETVAGAGAGAVAGAVAETGAGAGDDTVPVPVPVPEPEPEPEPEPDGAEAAQPPAVEEPPAPRRRTAPVAGSAAERAAERRARIRAQADEKGNG